ncbi:hypothetical protein M9H77_08566 [Catharanthus roseus]|uniref:Uncharacterized protein n=1 Tax=Catharanthus roseus TaxID=4058 RepID=A0ACC0BYC1_CATRO|nr:hypothetical protein M9H77_08566 [Catharanthus roseus]
MNSSCVDKWKPVFAMLGVNLALAVNNVLLKKVLNQGMSYLMIITYRQTISTIFLIPIAYFYERKGWNSLRGSLVWGLFFSALLGATLSQYFFLVGLKYTSATYSCAFINIVPVVTFIVALPFRLEKVNLKKISGKAKVLGTLIGVGGSLVLALYKGIPLINSTKYQNSVVEKAKHGTKDWVVGSLFLFGGSTMWSSWFVIQARIGNKFPFQYSSTAILSFFSAVQSAILCLIVDRNISQWILKGPLEISSVIYAGIVGSGLCYVVMSWCLKQRGPVFTSAFSPFIQIFVAVFDVSLLHEEINLGSILGSIIVIAGMYILLWGKSKEATESEDQCDCNVKNVPNADGEKGTDSNLNLPLPVTVPNPAVSVTCSTNHP